mmetsp:Transcript_26934/g.104568  ORF Transcript_26934/g.104568 Transcript_26934/m.104568 type:complete len:200 (+) Transcript_26934:5668-6267(+)
MNASVTFFGISGCRPPWSSTRPFTSLDSLLVRCSIAMISTICRSSGWPSLWIVSTASVTISESTVAKSETTLVASEHLAISTRSSRSIFLSNAVSSIHRLSSSLARSNPSVTDLGWSPSTRYLSACFKSSPMISTVEVVPSPHTSSWAVAVLAIMDAVGFWICISFSNTFPSLVILISPAPETSILIVPFGPRLLRRTS